MNCLCKIKQVLLLFCLVGQSLFFFALNPVVIEGKAAFAKNGQLRFYFYNDLFLQQKTLHATTNVNKDGDFRVSIQTNETALLIIAYQSTYGYIYIEPEKQYKLELSADENLLKRIDAEMLGAAIEIRITNTDTAELNYKISRFDRYFSHFLYLYALEIYQNVPVQRYDSLIGLLTEKFPVSNNDIDYYSVYVKYRIADIDLMYYCKNKEKIYNKYLDNDYVFYNNVAYMEFLNGFFEKYLYSGNQKIPLKILYENINEKRDYYRLLDAMGKDPFLVNERIREIVFIKSLEELYELNEEFNQTNILYLLSAMKENSKFDEHKKMSDNRLQYFNKLKSGTKAPDFELRDVYNSPVKISNFEGKCLYIHFFSTYCEDCIREMIALKTLREQYKDSLQIISVMLDFEQANLYHFVKTYKEFDWQFLHFANNYSFIDAYNVSALPLGVLIDGKGRIINYPAKSPKEGLTMQIFSLFPTVKPPQEQGKNKY